MHGIYLLIILAVPILTTFSISMNMITILGTPVMHRAPTSYTRAITTTWWCMASRRMGQIMIKPLWQC